MIIKKTVDQDFKHCRNVFSNFKKISIVHKSGDGKATKDRFDFFYKKCLNKNSGTRSITHS